MKRRSEVERVERFIFETLDLTACDVALRNAIRELAEWHLREVRRARGVTVGWAVVHGKSWGTKRACGTVYRQKEDGPFLRTWAGGELCRVVRVKAARKGRR